MEQFSPSSRAAFKTRLYMVDRTKAAHNRWLWITLTCMIPPKEPFKVLEDAYEALKRRAGSGVVVIWRNQIQQRGVLHHHALLYLPGVGSLTPKERQLVDEHFVERWSDRVLQETWAPATQNDVRTFEDNDAMEKAVAYISSDAQDYAVDQRGNIVELTGRRWGIMGRKAYKAITSPETFRLDDVNLAFDLRRQLRQARKAEMRSWRKPRKYRTARRSVDLRIYVQSAVARRLLAKEIMKARIIAKRFGLPSPIGRR